MKRANAVWSVAALTVLASVTGSAAGIAVDNVSRWCLAALSAALSGGVVFASSVLVKKRTETSLSV